jgi:hypothetical protein
MSTRLIFRQVQNQGRKTSIQSMGVDNADISTTQVTLQAVDDFELASQTLNAAK